MKYIKDYKDGDRVFDIYFCKFKSSAVTKNGKNYDNVILQDKTGTLDAKIWDPNNVGIADFEAMDYIEVYGDVTSFNGALQVNVKRVRRCSAEEYDERNYMPVSRKDNDEMYAQLLTYIESIENTYLKTLLKKFFVDDTTFVQRFRKSSAAKTVHHGFIGGLLEHTLGVTTLCDFYCKQYPILNRDLLLAAAMCHDMGKTREISAFPANDYTDEGQFLGHIVIGSEMIREKIREIPDFPPLLEMELKHCILAHHGEYEFGSPKKPAIIEAVALCYADNTDAKMETFKELLESTKETNWLGYNKLFESNLAVSRMK
ncbi:MAG: HD domain-containing protein [Lachnospiraceae bacterium]|jgi:Predicted HD-superfamily hydrolase